MIKRVITLHQPWASAMFVPGMKAIETRPWQYLYQGRLWIHAASTIPAYAKEFLRNVPKSLAGEFAKLPDPLPCGVILGSVDLVRCERMEECDRCDGCGWFEGGKVLQTPCGDCQGRGCRPPSVKLSPAEAHCGNYSPGRWAWITRDAQLLAEPVLAKGKQGIWGWEPPADVERMLRRLA